MTSSAPAARGGALQLSLVAALVAGALAAAYSMAFYAGPYRWLAEKQLRWFDAYYVSLTVILTLCLFVVPPLVAARVLVAGGRIASDSTLALLVSSGIGARLRERVARARFWLILLVVGGGLIVLSVRDLAVAARGKQLEALTASALEAGAQPRGTWLEIQGTPVWDATIESEERHQRWSFVPIVSEQWQPGAKVRALLRVRSDEAEQVDANALRGTLDWTGVPGVVRSAYREAQLDVEDALLIDYGTSPAERTAASNILIGLGGVLALIGGAGAVRRMR